MKKLIAVFLMCSISVIAHAEKKETKACTHLAENTEWYETHEYSMERWLNTHSYGIKMADSKEEELADDAALCEQSKKPYPKLGMAAKQVREKTNWGVPNSINRSGNAHKTYEQWVYIDKGYLYFENGILTSYQY